jgi:hypothetical protein
VATETLPGRNGSLEIHLPAAAKLAKGCPRKRRGDGLHFETAPTQFYNRLADTVDVYAVAGLEVGQDSFGRNDELAPTALVGGGLY